MVCPYFFFIKNMSRLAVTVFEGGPDDTLAVQDVYGSASEKQTINSFQDQAAATIDSTIGALKSVGVGNIINMIKTVNGAKSQLTAAAAIARMVGSNAALQGYLRNLSASSLNALGISPNLVKEVTVAVGTYASLINPKNVGDVRAIAGAINSITGNFVPQINDMGAMSSLVGGLTTLSSSLGLPGVYSALANAANAAGLNNSALINAAAIALPRALATGNMSALRDLAGNVMAKEINALVPNLAKSMVSKFRASLHSSYDDVNEALLAVDPNYQSCSRSGGNAVDASAAVGTEYAAEAGKAAMSDVSTLGTGLYDGDADATRHLSYDKLLYVSSGLGTPRMTIADDYEGAPVPAAQVNVSASTAGEKSPTEDQNTPNKDYHGPWDNYGMAYSADYTPKGVVFDD
jgi:hypothetical protein